MIKLCHTIINHIYVVPYYVTLIMYKEKNARVCVFALIILHAIWISIVPYYTLIVNCIYFTP
jgi:hypothetical protein